VCNDSINRKLRLRPVFVFFGNEDYQSQRKKRAFSLKADLGQPLAIGEKHSPSSAAAAID